MRNDATGRRAFLRSATAAGALAAIPGARLASGAHPAQESSAKKSSFDVTAFGAKGEGKTIDTPAINKAIEAAAAAGGGTVDFPAGTYTCYSIHLKSHVALRLSHGTTILAAEPSAAGGTGNYDEAESNKPWEDYQDYGHNHGHNSLLWGEGIEDVSIVGPGLIWGKGLSRGTRELPRAETPGVGNKALALKNCHDVLLRDFSILHGGHFGILATGVDNLTIDNLKIDTNRDGMDIDCCVNVRVSNCTVNSPWDDGICLKSSYALGKARATEMVTITNCLVTGDYEEGSVLDTTYKHFGPDTRVGRTGRIKFGTESNGGFKNVAITNCVFEGCRGLALESVDGALLEDVAISNITMRDIFGPPIFLRLGSRMRGPEGVPIGDIRRVTISNVVCSNATSPASSIISGIPGHEIEDLKLHDILIQHQGGGTKEQAALQPPEKENAYPEPTMFGPTPSHGFFIRHVKNIEMNGVRIMAQKEDARPAFVLNDVQNAELFQIKVPENQTSPAVVLKDVKDFRIGRSEPVADAHVKEAKEKEL